MSGGHWNYMNDTLQNEMFGYYFDDENKRKQNPFEDAELSELAYDLFNLIHELDWYLSGDTGEEYYIECKKKFKKKWLRNEKYKDEVLRKIIEQEFEDKKQQVLKIL